MFLFLAIVSPHFRIVSSERCHGQIAGLCDDNAATHRLLPRCGGNACHRDERLWNSLPTGCEFKVEAHVDFAKRHARRQLCRVEARRRSNAKAKLCAGGWWFVSWLMRVSTEPSIESRRVQRCVRLFARWAGCARFFSTPRNVSGARGRLTLSMLLSTNVFGSYSVNSARDDMTPKPVAGDC